MNELDMSILREWAEAKVSRRRFATDYDLEVARHILATTTPPTMADIAWDDDVHTGLCAESTDDGTDGVVRMIGLDWVDDHADHIMCYLGNGQFDSLPFRALTPIPGARLDLTPRREPEPESTPDHPAVLTTEKDYAQAPTGTVVADDSGDPWVKDDLGFWLICGEGGSEISRLMALAARRVLRWGETL